MFKKLYSNLECKQCRLVEESARFDLIYTNRQFGTLKPDGGYQGFASDVLLHQEA